MRLLFLLFKFLVTPKDFCQEFVGCHVADGVVGSASITHQGKCSLACGKTDAYTPTMMHGVQVCQTPGETYASLEILPAIVRSKGPTKLTMWTSTIDVEENDGPIGSYTCPQGQSWSCKLNSFADIETCACKPTPTPAPASIPILGARPGSTLMTRDAGQKFPDCNSPWQNCVASSDKKQVTCECLTLDKDGHVHNECSN